MRKLALGLFISFILIILSIPGCVAAPQSPLSPVESSDSVILIVRNESLAPVRVFIMLEFGGIIRTFSVEPQSFGRIDVPRSLFTSHQFRFYIRSMLSGDGFQSFEMPSTLDVCDLFVDDPLEDSHSMCYNGPAPGARTSQADAP